MCVPVGTHCPFLFSSTATWLSVPRCMESAADPRASFSVSNNLYLMFAPIQLGNARPTRCFLLALRGLRRLHSKRLLDKAAYYFGPRNALLVRQTIKLLEHFLGKLDRHGGFMGSRRGLFRFHRRFLLVGLASGRVGEPIRGGNSQRFTSYDARLIGKT